MNRGLADIEGPSAAVVFPDAQWQTASPQSQGVDPHKLGDAMNYLASVCGEHGTAESLVVRNGYVLWTGSNVTNRHLIWSCTKSFTSSCLGLLWDDGKCSPQTLACSVMPELKAAYPTVTLEHLATFTSGYDCVPNEFLKPRAPMYKPGTAMHYSEQSDLLAALLTRIAGEPLETLFLRRIGNEIGLGDGFQWGSKHTIDGIRLNGGAGYPGTGVECNALAMARFGWLYCNGGNWNGKQLISRRYIDYATKPRVSPDVPPHDPKGWYTLLPGSYGLNWWVNGTRKGGGRMWPSAPEGTFAAQGNNNNICFIVPAWRMVIVRLGNDKIIDTDLYDRVFALIGEALNAR